MSAHVYSAYTETRGVRYQIPADVADAQRSFMSNVEHNVTTKIRVARDEAQLEMVNLNDRLANYIEKIAFMKDQNQYLSSALEAMKEKSQKSETVSVMYEAEATEINLSIDQLNHEKSLLQEEILAEQNTFDNLLNKYQEAINDYNISEAEAQDLRRKYSGLKAKINLISEEMADLSGKVDRINNENEALRQKIAEAQRNLDNEARQEAGARTDVNTLLEECKTISSTYAYEIEKVVASKRGTTPDTREELRQQLAADIQKIRDEYENLIRRDISELQQRYQITQSFTEETQLPTDDSELRMKVAALRLELSEQRRLMYEAEGRRADLEQQRNLYQRELEEEQRLLERLHNQNYESVRQVSNELRTLMSEVQMTMKSNQTLDAEITLYRQMLEGAEERAGFRQL